jgi:hypothetical protein
MSEILDAPVGEQRAMATAGFWIRFAAYFIDGILLGIVNVIITLIVEGT